MCGIIGVVGQNDPVPVLLSGLRRLEYRGYDSAGVATVNGHIQCCRAQGKLSQLERKLAETQLSGHVGIGHTRWATHGAPSETNAHPIATSRVAVVHNGIIENHDELRQELAAAGYHASSETDTECIAGLLTLALDEGRAPDDAMQSMLARLEGSFAMAVLLADQPDMLLCARRGSPLAIGHDEGAMYIGSDAIALAPLTQRISYLDDDDWGVITPQGATLFDAAGKAVKRTVRSCGIGADDTGKGAHAHYMAKEIAEQPRVIADTLRMLTGDDGKSIRLPDDFPDLASVNKVTIVACGTSLYAAATARYWLEQLAGVPVAAEIASEFRYQHTPLTRDTLTIFVSQSGETADTLACLRDISAAGFRSLVLTNCAESSMAREADAALVLPAGPEIGVAATKTFTAQLSALACLAIATGRARGVIAPAREQKLLASLFAAPDAIERFLMRSDGIEEAAALLASAQDAVYLGRGSAFPLALEGALKLKEIAYVHAEGFAAGEMKHGPIALIDANVPVVIIAPSNELFDKIASNTHEVAARGGRIILVSDEAGHARIAETGAPITRIVVPECNPIAEPLLYAIPMQVLAYRAACLRGTDVDQPRNLAKSVTVE